MEKNNEPTFEICPHDKENPYVMISKEMAQDKSISPKAKGVLLYLLSLPKNWKIYHSQLQSGLGIGEEYLNSAIEELILAGYADRSRERIKGIFQSYKYKIREFKKCSPNPKIRSGELDDELSDTPDRVNRPGSSGPENPVILKTDTLNTELNTVCKRQEPPLGEKEISDKENESTRLNGALTYRHTIHLPNGDLIEISKEEIYRRSCAEYSKLSWTNAEIAEAWESFINSKAPIISPWRYLEKTIEAIRMALKKKQQSQYCKRNSIKSNDIKENIECQPEKNTLPTDSKQKSENCNKNSVEETTSVRVSPSSHKPLILTGESEPGYWIRKMSSFGQERQEREKPILKHA